MQHDKRGCPNIVSTDILRYWIHNELDIRTGLVETVKKEHLFYPFINGSRIFLERGTHPSRSGNLHEIKENLVLYIPFPPVNPPLPLKRLETYQREISWNIGKMECNSGSKWPLEIRKNSVPQWGVEPWPLTIWASIIITRLPRHLIAVTFTPPRRKHVLMHFELRDHIGHQM